MIAAMPCGALPVRTGISTALGIGAQTTGVTSRQIKEEFFPVLLLRGAQDLPVTVGAAALTG